MEAVILLTLPRSPVQQGLPLYEKPRYVPACAAARCIGKSVCLAEKGQLVFEIMSLCLEHGGDINLNVPMGHKELKITTPLLMFLDALDERAWAKAAVGAGALASALITSLKYLLDHGADPLGPSHPNVSIYLWLDDPYGDDYEPTEEKPWMLLTHPSVSADRTARTLARACAQPGARTLTTAWRRLVDAVTEHFAVAAGKLDELLFVFVVRTGTCPVLDNTLSCSNGCHHKVGDGTRATTHLLLDAGADVNWTWPKEKVDLRYDDELLPACGVVDVDVRPTALHLMDHWVSSETLSYHPTVLAECPGAVHKFVVGKERQKFVRFLVEECGADPDLRFDGCYFPLDSFLNKFNM
ncbi:hypothetical protein RB600_004219 [Gaeumannomyces tritici]